MLAFLPKMAFMSPRFVCVLFCTFSKIANKSSCCLVLGALSTQTQNREENACSCVFSAPWLKRSEPPFSINQQGSTGHAQRPGTAKHSSTRHVRRFVSNTHKKLTSNTMSNGERWKACSLKPRTEPGRPPFFSAVFWRP